MQIDAAGRLVTAFSDGNRIPLNCHEDWMAAASASAQSFQRADALRLAKDGLGSLALAWVAVDEPAL